MTLWSRFSQKLSSEVDPTVSTILHQVETSFNPYAHSPHPDPVIKVFDSRNTEKVKSFNGRDDRYRAAHVCNPITLESQGIMINADAMSCGFNVAGLVTHERTHYEQVLQKKKNAAATKEIPPSHYTLTPKANIGYHFMTEAEACGVEDYKILRDYLSGTMSKDELDTYIFDDAGGYHFNDFVAAYIGKDVPYVSDTEEALSQYAKDNPIRPMDDVMSDYMYRLSKNPGFKGLVVDQSKAMTAMAAREFFRGRNVLEEALGITADDALIGERVQSIKRQYGNPKNFRLFSQGFDFEQGKKIICRDGRDFFKDTPAQKRDEMWQNVFDIHPEQQRKLNYIDSEMIKKNGLDR